MYSSMFLVSKFSGGSPDETRDPPPNDARRVGELPPKILGSLRTSASKAEEIIQRNTMALKRAIDMNNSSMNSEDDSSAELNVEHYGIPTAAKSYDSSRKESTRLSAEVTIRSLSQALVGVQADHAKLQESCDKANQQLATSQQQIKTLEATLKERDETVASLQEAMEAGAATEQSEKDVEQAEARIRSILNEKELLEATLHEKDQTIASLQKSLSGKKTVAEQVAGRLGAVMKQQEQLEATLQERNQTIADLKASQTESTRVHAPREADHHQEHVEAVLQPTDIDVEDVRKERDEAVECLEKAMALQERVEAELQQRNETIASLRDSLATQSTAVQQVEERLREALLQQEQLEQELDRVLKKNRPWWQCR